MSLGLRYARLGEKLIASDGGRYGGVDVGVSSTQAICKIEYRWQERCDIEGLQALALCAEGVLLQCLQQLTR